jgi:hypothetical protein
MKKCFSVHIPSTFHGALVGACCFILAQKMVIHMWHWRTSFIGFATKKKNLEYFVKGVGNETNDKQKNEIIMNVLLILLYHVACHQIASIGI